jgi:hypothetical protein
VIVGLLIKSNPPETYKFLQMYAFEFKSKNLLSFSKYRPQIFTKISGGGLDEKGGENIWHDLSSNRNWDTSYESVSILELNSRIFSKNNKFEKIRRLTIHDQKELFLPNAQNLTPGCFIS